MASTEVVSAACPWHVMLWTRPWLDLLLHVARTTGFCGSLGNAFGFQRHCGDESVEDGPNQRDELNDEVPGDPPAGLARSSFGLGPKALSDIFLEYSHQITK